VKRDYLDSSAFVKLLIEEPESAALRRWLRGREWTSSALLRSEAVRAVRSQGHRAIERAQRLIGRGELLRLNPAVLDLSGMFGPADLRTLDAIHLASATSLGDDLSGIVTYDRRMAAAAESLHMRVTAPA
jgi:predicted nucleic acid-binding protein